MAAVEEHTQLPWKVAFRVQFTTEKYGIKFYPSPLPDTGNGLYTIQVLEVPRAADPATYGPAQQYNESLKPEQAHLAVRAGLYLTHINDTNLLRQPCEQVIRQLTSVPRPVKLRFVDVDSGVVTLKELQEGRYARTSLSKAQLDALLQEPPPTPESPPVESRDAVPTTSPEPFLAPPPLPPPPFVVTVAPSTHVAPATQAIPLPPPTYTTEHVYKLILLGTTGVGKSSVLSVGVGGAAAFSDRPAATLEAEFGTLCVPDPDVATNKMLKAQVWDTAGQERYRAMTRSHYRRADGALLVYDVADPESFDKLAGWLADLREMAGDSIKSILVLENKIDQLPDAVVSGVEPRPSQFVNEAAVAAFCKVNGLLFARSSAKMNRTAFRWAGKPVEEVVGQLLLNVHATHLARGLKLQQEQLAKQLVSLGQVVATSSSTPIVLCASPSIVRAKSGDCGCGGT